MAKPEPTDVLGMSDDDFANLNGPPEVEASGGAIDENGDDASKNEEENKDDQSSGEDQSGEDESGSENNDDTNEDDQSGEGDDGVVVDPAGSKEAKAPEDKGEGDEEKPKEPKVEQQSVDYESFYKEIMKPFKANGKTIELRDPKEAISLMQMGANYTRKLQDLQPHRKMIMMLQNNDLLDEGKLSFLIDLDKRDPEAIKKLVKESGIDPLDIDTAEDSTYRPGSHIVTDDEASFKITMEEMISSDPSARETVSEIYDSWDGASKEVLWKTPDIMTVIHEARSNGVYDLIKAEVDRRKTLGQIPPNLPFLQAYKIVGDEMVAQTLGPDGKGAKPGAVVDRRAAAPKSKLKDGDKASAASPTRATPNKQVKPVQNPLAMSDEDFLKQMEGRL
jgi:hypothetical protein